MSLNDIERRITGLFIFIFEVLSGILGIIFLIVTILVWLGYLGIIPKGPPVSDDPRDSYSLPI